MPTIVAQTALAAINADALSDRVFVRPVALRERLVDQRDRRRVQLIRHGEEAALTKGISRVRK